MFFDNCQALVIKIDFDQYLNADIKHSDLIKKYTKQLEMLKASELSSSTDSKGDKILHKPTFVLLNQFDSRPVDEAWNAKLKSQVTTSPAKRTQSHKNHLATKELEFSLNEHCVKNSWNFIASSSISKNRTENNFNLNPTINNAKNEHVKTFLSFIHQKLLSLGHQARKHGVESQLVVKETNPEELEKLIEVYRKEAANQSTKVSLFGNQNARDSLIKLETLRNDDRMKNILQHNI